MANQTKSFSPENNAGSTACVIVAGGIGTRCGRDRPKQFCMLGGEPVLAHTVRHFDQAPAVDQIVVVVPEALLTDTRELLEELNLQKPWRAVAGGARRQDSVLAGLRACLHTEKVLVHDGARPFPPVNLEDALDLATDGGAAGTPAGAVFATPVTDSIKRVAASTIQQTLPRHDLWAMQTPQVFPTNALVKALERCDADGAEITDDASAFEHLGWPVQVAEGARNNIKITYPEDFAIAEAILASRRQTAADPITENLKEVFINEQ